MNGKAKGILTERFGRDTLLSIATMSGTRPDVRIVNSYYENGSFYVVTYSLSKKTKQILENSYVAVCGEWFTAHGIGKNLGHPLSGENTSIMEKLREVFAEWYYNGHTDESDPNTCILQIKLTDGTLFSKGERFDIDFTGD